MLTSKWRHFDKPTEAGWLGRIDGLIAGMAPVSLAQLALRFGLSVPFWRSGMSKWDGFLQLNDVAILLFTSEFKLHLPGGPYDFPAPAVMAFAVACAEILLPTFLMLGLATRWKPMLRRGGWRNRPVQSIGHHTRRRSRANQMPS